MPLAILEALAAGRAVVATAVDGVAEIVRDGDTGLLVPPSDPRALAEAISRLLLDDDLRSGLARRGRQSVEEHHTAAAMTTKLEAAYEAWWRQAGGNALPRSIGARA
jgi:glycosyltransferase involved in cell wall biosynthesis